MDTEQQVVQPTAQPVVVNTVIDQVILIQVITIIILQKEAQILRVIITFKKEKHKKQDGLTPTLARASKLVQLTTNKKHSLQIHQLPQRNFQSISQFQQSIKRRIYFSVFQLFNQIAQDLRTSPLVSHNLCKTSAVLRRFPASCARLPYISGSVKQQCL